MNKKQSQFSFNTANLEKANKVIAKYPKDRKKSALIPLLDLAQRQNDNWLSVDVMNYVADLLSIPYIAVYEVASFYTMFNLKPVGKFHVQICGTTPCWLRGADKIKEACKRKLRIELGETTKDNKFTLSEVECLGACANAPMIQINDDYYEDLTSDSVVNLLDDLANNKKIKTGSQIGRKCSAPWSTEDA